MTTTCLFTSPHRPIVTIRGISYVWLWIVHRMRIEAKVVLLFLQHERMSIISLIGKKKKDDGVQDSSLWWVMLCPMSKCLSVQVSVCPMSVPWQAECILLGLTLDDLDLVWPIKHIRVEKLCTLWKVSHVTKQHNTTTQQHTHLVATLIMPGSALLGLVCFLVTDLRSKTPGVEPLFKPIQDFGQYRKSKARLILLAVPFITAAEELQRLWAYPVSILYE